MNPVESRPLRYFVAVAEELNFTRAAERLAIAPPALSRAISQLETQLGFRLLDRTTRKVTLTEAGVVLLEEGRRTLAALESATRRARRAAETPRQIVLTHKADLDGGLLEQAMRRHAEEHASVKVVLSGWGEQPQMLREGRANVALLYSPFDDREIDHSVLLEEAQLVALPADDPLAARAELWLKDLEAEYQRTTGPYVWRPRVPGLGMEEPPDSMDIARLLALVEQREVIAFLPASVAARFGRPQIAYRPVQDAPPVTLSVAWPRSETSLSTAAFIRTITDLAAGQHLDASVAPLHLVQPGAGQR